VKARKAELDLSTGRRALVRVDLSVRVMTRTGLIAPADERGLLNALDDVVPDDNGESRRIQDALVLHALDLHHSHELDGLAESEFLELLGYAIRQLTLRENDPAEIDDTDLAEDANDAPAELSLDDELERARAEDQPGMTVPASARAIEIAEAGQPEEEPELPTPKDPLA
jgi:hypothetical protein